MRLDTDSTCLFFFRFDATRYGSEGKEYGSTSVALGLYEELTAIQRGETEDPYGWTVVL